MVSRLSDVLEQNPDERYSLSEKACQGILRRAKARGKALPQILEAALERQMFELSQPLAIDGYNQTVSVTVGSLRAGRADGDHIGMVIQQAGCDIYNLAVTGDVAVALTTSSNATGSGPTVMEVYTYDAGGNGDGTVVNTITGDHENRITDYTALAVSAIPIHDKATRYQGGGQTRNGDGAGNGLGVGAPGAPCPTLSTADRHMVCYVDTSHANDVVRMDEVAAPLQARDYKGGKLVQTKHIVRRLTPLECERLQGFPDGWTDIGEWVDSKGKKHKEADSPRYKALGNSIAIPPWKWVLKRLCACYERDATMASLFDGIGGFPYIWEQLNGKGSCLWASEIEEFPMAVTKLRFGGGA